MAVMVGVVVAVPAAFAFAVLDMHWAGHAAAASSWQSVLDLFVLPPAFLLLF